MRETRVSLQPFPLFHLEISDTEATNISGWIFRFLLNDHRELLLGSEFRCVSIDNLDRVRSAGIDVDPFDAPIYVGDPGKAVEYGGWPKVMLAIDRKHLDRTCRKISSATPPDELNALIKIFPTVLKSTDGSMLWLSRLAASDPRVGSAYEWAYGRWITGDSRKALRAVFLILRPQDAVPLSGS